MRECWGWLDKTSRSFSMVIKELDGDLARVVSVHALRRLCSANVSYAPGLHLLPRTPRFGHGRGRYDHPQLDQAALAQGLLQQAGRAGMEL